MPSKAHTGHAPANTVKGPSAEYGILSAERGGKNESAVKQKISRPLFAVWVTAGLIAFVAFTLLQWNRPPLKFIYRPEQLSSTLENGIPQGFYAPQQDSLGERYIWTQGRASVRFDFPVPRPAVNVMLELRSAAVAGGVDAPVCLEANGVEIAQLHPDPKDSDFQVFSLDISQWGSAEKLQLDLVAQTFQPRHENRVLGTMVKSISIDKSQLWSRMERRRMELWVLPVLALTLAILLWISRRNYSALAGYGAVAACAVGLGVSIRALMSLLRIGVIDRTSYSLWLASLLYLAPIFLFLTISLPFGAPSALSLTQLLQRARRWVFSPSVLPTVVKLLGIIIFLVPSLILISSEATLPGKTLSLLGITGVGLFFLALSWRLGLAGLLSGTFLLTVITIYQYKIAFLGQPLLAIDIIFFFKQLMANVTILLRYGSLVQKVALAAFVLALIGLAFYKAEKPFSRGSKSRVPILRILTLLSALLILRAAPVIVYSTNYAFFRALKEIGPWDLVVSPGNILSTLILSFEKMSVTIPGKHFPDLQESRRIFNFNSESSSRPVSEYPDIILWHDESTLDPTTFEACNVPECQFNLFKKDAYTEAHGLLRVNCFGGASWISEFAILTGLNHQLFGEGGWYTHFALAPRITYALPLLLKKHGYRTIALYPNIKHFFNAYHAYRLYGFDEFYAPEDLGLPVNPWLITDQVMYEEMAKILRDHRSGPIFVFVLTQFQHGPHNQPVERLPEPYKSLRIPRLSHELQINLANYLYRLNLTDVTLADLETSFLRAKNSRKTIFLHFGDHQPSFDGLILQMAKKGMDRFPSELHHYLTQFSMKTNFPTLIQESHEYLDISFLGSLILDAAALPKDRYFSANAKLRTLCDGKYMDCENKELLARYHDYIFYELGALR